MQLKARPSGLARIIACPGSLRACANAPAWMDDEGDNTVREEGTACHHFAHQSITTGTKFKYGDKAPNGYEYDADMEKAIAEYRQYLDTWPEHHSVTQAFLEQTLPIPGVGEGTPDAQGLGTHQGQHCIYIADLKYGYRIVEAFPNYQLIAYLMGIAVWYGLSIADIWACFTIVQPRRWHRAGTTRTWYVHGSQLQPYIDLIINAVSLSMQDNTPLKPGKHCSYCPARAQCTAARDIALGVTIAMPEEIPLDFAEQEMVFLQRYIDVASAYMDGLRAQIEHDIRAGKRATRFEITRKQGRKVWSAPDQARVIANLMGVNIESKPELITPTQAITAGIPAAVVNMFSKREPGKTELTPIDASKWAAIFKGAK